MQVLRHDRLVHLHVRHILSMRAEDVMDSARKLRPTFDARHVFARDEGRAADRWRDGPARRDGTAKLVQPLAGVSMCIGSIVQVGAHPDNQRLGPRWQTWGNTTYLCEMSIIATS